MPFCRVAKGHFLQKNYIEQMKTCRNNHKEAFLLKKHRMIAKRSIERKRSTFPVKIPLFTTPNYTKFAFCIIGYIEKDRALFVLLGSLLFASPEFIR